MFMCGKYLQKRNNFLYIAFSVMGNTPIQETVMQVSLYL